MRSCPSRLRLACGLLSLLTTMGCGDDDGAARTGQLDGGLTRELDAESAPSLARDSGKNPDGAGPNTPPSIASASAAACSVEPLAASGAQCGLTDPTEPNSRLAPAQLELGSTCSELRAVTADKDEDAYRFRIDKSDPVSLELSYVVHGTGALTLAVSDANERPVISSKADTQSPVERQQVVFQGGAKSSYEVEVVDDRVGTCLPYALRVNASWCTDGYEDNDSADAASTLSGAAPLQVEATTSSGDLDFYQFVTPKADPVRFSGSYTVADGDTLQLRRVLENTSGLGTLDVPGARTGSRETFSHWLVSNAAGAVFRAQLIANGSGCAPYQLAFDVAACTDDFEDNDTAASAAKLLLDVEVSATAFRADDDYYDVSTLARGGSCTVGYTLASEGAQALRLDIYGGSSMLASSSDESSATGAHRVQVTWQGQATALVVSARSAGVCQPYTLICKTPGAPPVQ